MLSCNAVNLGAVWTQWERPGLRSFHRLLGMGSKWGEAWQGGWWLHSPQPKPGF